MGGGDGDRMGAWWRWRRVNWESGVVCWLRPFPEGGGGPYISAVGPVNVLFRNGFAARIQVSSGCGFRGPGLGGRPRPLRAFFSHRALGPPPHVLEAEFWVRVEFEALAVFRNPLASCFGGGLAGTLWPLCGDPAAPSRPPRPPPLFNSSGRGFFPFWAVQPRPAGV